MIDDILNDIKTEREYQQDKWGDEFDSKNTANDWASYIIIYVGQAITMPWNKKTFRTQLLKVATLCVAAIEWCDKDSIPPRHYD